MKAIRTLRRSTLLATLSAVLSSAWLCSLALAPLPARAWETTTGSGRSASETRQVADFQAITLAGSMDLTVRQGAQQKLELQADDNLLPLLETTVETTKLGSTLVVRWKKGYSIVHRGKVQLSVVLPKLSAVNAAGSGDIRFESFSTPALQVLLSGSGDVKFDGLSTDDLGLRISGRGNAGGKGSATRMAVNIAGSGDVHLSELRADEVDVHIAGSGSAFVNAQKTLDVRIAGSGDVSYIGNPTVKSKVAGSGSVTKR